MSPKEIDELDTELVWGLYKHIEVLEAEEALTQLMIIDYPALKQEYRIKTHGILLKQANQLIIKEERAITTKDLAKLINGG